MESDMKISRALGIVHDIENEKISDHEKAVAIFLLCIRSERINELQKKEMIGIIRWLWHRNFLIRKKQKPNV